MKGGMKSSHGFTIIEIMIFLAVSGVIFISAMAAMAGKQDRTEFSTSLYNLQSQLQGIINNVTNGYYNTVSNYTCNVYGSGPSASVVVQYGSSNIGQNLGCTFIGEVIEFKHNISAAGDGYYVYPVVGLQYKYGEPPTQVTSLSEAKPVALYQYGSSYVNAYQKVVLPYGISVHQSGGNYSLSYSNNTSGSCGLSNGNIGAFGFFTTFNGYTGGGLDNGSQDVQLVPIPGSSLNLGQYNTVSLIDSLQDNGGNCVTSGGSQITKNPSQGVSICLDSGTTNESAKITIGGVNNPTALSMKRYSSKGCV